MDERLENLRSTKNPKARIKIMKGHFATSNSHLDTYIDMSTVKIRHNNAREAAKVLAQEYVTSTYVDTIVCLDETSVIGAFLAEQLADSTHMALSHKNNISVITPEYNGLGQIMFRDNQQRMICGVCSIFSAVTKVAGMEVKTIFTSKDLPAYHAYEPNKCPMCEAGDRVEAIVNSFGYSKL